MLTSTVFFFIQWSWITVPRDQLARMSVLRPRGILTGRVMPLTRNNYQIRVHSFNDLKMKSQVCLWDDFNLSDGDFIQAEGILYPLPFATNPHQFDYGRFLLSQGSQATFNAENLLVLSKSNNWFDKIRNSVRDRINRYLYPDSAIIGIVSALTVGDRSRIDPDLRFNFQRGGVAHLLAISGLHVGIIFFLMTTFFKTIRISKRLRYFIAVCFLVFYLFIAGANPSVWRAVILVTVYSLAVIFQRDRDMYHIMGIAGLVILIRHPLELWNTGFLLSFGSVLALIFLFPDLWKLAKSILKNNWVKWLAASFLSITIIYLGTWPVLSCSYGEIYPVAWLSNLVMIPYLSLLLVSIILFLIFPQLGGGVFTLSLKFLAGIFINLTDFFSKLSTGCWQIPTPSWYLVLAYYLMLIGFKLWINNRKYFRWWLISLLILIIAVFYNNFNCRYDYIIVFDVGQGDACLIHTHRGTNILIDGGPGNYSASGIILPFIQGEGIDNLDLIIATHPDADHIGGLPEIISRYPHSPVLTNGLTRNTEIYSHFRNASGNREMIIRAGYKIIGEDFSIEFQAPSVNDLRTVQLTDNHNAASLFMLVLIRSDSNLYIFPGDGELIDLDLKSKFKNIWLHASHHGDRVANPARSLLSICPHDLVISCGKYNSYGHPHQEVVFLTKIFPINCWRTDRQGALKFYLPDLNCRCYNHRYLWHEYR